MPFPITSCISLTANIWLSSSFISIRPLVCFPVAHIYLCRIDEKAKQATIRYGWNLLAGATLKVHLKGITLQWRISLFVLLFPWNHSSCGRGHKPAFCYSIVQSVNASYVYIYLYACVPEKRKRWKSQKTFMCFGFTLCLCGSTCMCVRVCMHACTHARTHVSSSYTAVPPLGTPLHVFFSSVNSWLLEQNNCHFPASGSKVIQHNEMYKKEGEMADRRHAKSNVERSE